MMKKAERIIEVLTNENPDAIIYDNMSEALLGVYRNKENDYLPVAVYSYVKYIDKFINEDGMSEEDAVEFFDFNVDGLLLGINQPIIIDDTGV